MVQRYDKCIWCGGEYGKDAEMTKSNDGDYVLYEDYEKLKAKLLLSESQNYYMICGNTLDGYKSKRV